MRGQVLYFVRLFDADFITKAGPLQASHQHLGS
jgi:hypothetical protein